MKAVVRIVVAVLLTIVVLLVTRLEASVASVVGVVGVLLGAVAARSVGEEGFARLAALLFVMISASVALRFLEVTGYVQWIPSATGIIWRAWAGFLGGFAVLSLLRLERR